MLIFKEVLLVLEKVKRFRSLISDHLDRLGISKYQLADIMGVSYEAVRLWCNGRSYPHIYHCYRLSWIFGCSIYDLYSFR